MAPAEPSTSTLIEMTDAYARYGIILLRDMLERDPEKFEELCLPFLRGRRRKRDLSDDDLAHIAKRLTAALRREILSRLH